MLILSSSQIADADKATIKTGITGLDLMEHAATLCFQWLHARLQGQQVPIYIFCGIGNNGGDGLVMARKLLAENYNVHCYVVNYSDRRSPEFLENYNRLKNLKFWPEIIKREKDFPVISEDAIVIDCIFGNGLNRPASGFTKLLIQHLNASGAFILSIDVPSGLFNDKSSPDKNAIIKASHILTFQCPKISFLLPETKAFVNTWEVIDIGLNQTFIDQLNIKKHFLIKNDIIQFYNPRKKWDHKGSFGHALMICGSFGKIGAAVLATKAALKTGAGLTTAYIPKCGYEIMQMSVPEAMTEVDNELFIEYFNFKTVPTVIAIGPGIGTHEKTLYGFKKFLEENTCPLVIDADGINLLAKDVSLLKLLAPKTVLTPHPKELERLIGSWANDFEKIEKVMKFSSEHNCILVVKGAHTLIVDGENQYFNSTGNQALATAGSGDVLTGIITGLIAQKYEPVQAALLGVYLHGKTADIAMEEHTYETFTASEILAYLPKAFIELLTPDAEIRKDSEENT